MDQDTKILFNAAKHNPETLPQVPTIFLLYSGSQVAVGLKVGVKGATQKEKTDLRNDIFYKPILSSTFDIPNCINLVFLCSNLLELDACNL